MPDYDAGFKIVARESGRELAELGDVSCDAWEPVTGEVHAAERLADRAFRARKGKAEFIVYMEAYTRWEAKAPWSVLAKSGLLSERERLACVSLVYVLSPRGYKKQHGTFHLAVDEQPTQQVWLREICLWELDLKPSWESSPGLMALSPLFRHQQSVEQTVAQAARCIKGHATDRIRESDLLAVLGIFGKLSSPGFDPFQVIAREAMRESAFLQQIEDEMRIATHQSNILQALEIRFGKECASALKEPLTTVQDSDELSKLHRAAIKSRTLGAFRKVLDSMAKSQPSH